MLRLQALFADQPPKSILIKFAKISGLRLLHSLACAVRKAAMKFIDKLSPLNLHAVEDLGLLSSLANYAVI